MNNSGKITDIVDVAQVEQQFDFLVSNLDKVLVRMEGIATSSTKVTNGFKKVGSVTELNNLIEKNIQLSQQALITDKEILKLKDQLLLLEEKQSKNEKEKVPRKEKEKQVLTEVQKIEAETIKTKEKLAAATSVEAKQLNELKAQLSETIIREKQAAKETLAAAGSIDQKSLKLGRLRDAYRQLSEADRTGESGQKMLKEIQALDKEVKGLDASIGNHQRNVGNYQSALEGLPGPIGNAVSGITAMGKALWALVANPIGIVIAALVGGVMLLYKAFVSTDSGATKMAGVFKGLGNIMNIVLDRVLSFGKALVSLVTFDWEGLKKNSSDAFGGIGSALNNAANAGMEYARAMDEIADRTASMVLDEARAENQIAKLRFISKDRTKSEKERLAAAKEAIDLERKIADEKVKIANMEADAEFNNLAAIIEVSGVGLEAKKAYLNAILGLTADELEAEKSKNKIVAEIYNENEEAIQNLQAKKAKAIEEDSRFYQENVRRQSEITGFIKGLEDERTANKEKNQKKQEEAIKKTNEELKKSFEYEKGFAASSAEIYNELAENEVANFETRFQALSEYERLKQDEINAAMGAELVGVEENSKQYNDILRKYNDEAGKITSDTEKKRTALVKSEAEKRNQIALAEIEIRNADELIALNNAYAAGAISLEAYEAERLRIIEAGGNAILQEQISQIELELLEYVGSTEQKAELEKQLAQLKQQLSDDSLSKQIANEQELTAKRKELANEAFNAIVSIIDSSFESRKNKIAGEIEELEKQHEREVQLAGDSSEKKAAADAKYNAKKQELEKKQRAIDIQKAKFDKAAAMAKIVMDTAVGIVAALAKGNVSLSILIGIIGGLQLATVAATPIPKYKGGTGDHIGGPAIVGEGNTELIELPSGRQFLTPSTDTLVNLPKHTKVFSNSQLLNMALSGMLPANYGEKRRENDGWREVTGALKAMSTQPQHNLFITERGFRKQVKQGNSITEYLSKSIYE